MIDLSNLSAYKLINTLYTSEDVKVVEALNHEGKKCVVKKIKFKSKSELKGLQTEIMIHKKAQLKCANVPKFYEDQVVKDYLYIVMELVEDAETLDGYLERQPTHKSKVGVFYQLLSIVNKLGSFGIQHRDIKPANILVTKDDLVYLIDFGLSGYFFSDDEASVHFRAPEQWAVNMKFATRTVDQYSLGVVFFYLFAGEIPKKGEHFNISRREKRDSFLKLPYEWIKPLSSYGYNKLVDNILFDLMNNIPERRPLNLNNMLRRVKQMERINR